MSDEAPRRAIRYTVSLDGSTWEAIANRLDDIAREIRMGQWHGGGYSTGHEYAASASIDVDIDPHPLTERQYADALEAWLERTREERRD